MDNEEKIKTADDFIEDSKKLIGLPVHDPGMSPLVYGARYGNPCTIDYEKAAKFSMSLGDDNPLYVDQVYPRSTKWGITLCQPSILTSVRYAICRGAAAWARYPEAGLVAGFSLKFNDVIRVGDTFASLFYLKDVLVKKGRTGTLVLKPTEIAFWNQYKELVATGTGNHINILRELSEEDLKKGEGTRSNMIYERGIYKYSKEEIKKIVDLTLNEKRQGSTPRYWEDVKIGDKLQTMVKGPLTMQDFFKVWAAIAGVRRVGTFGIALREAIEDYGTGGDRVNPVTGWPYESTEFEHYDFNLCKGRGLPAPFDIGVMRISIMSNYLSNWMGDGGFIRKFEGQLRKPNYYGDTQFYDGEVVNVYEDKIGDVTYGAVDISIAVNNQIGEISAPGKATVYLPSRKLGQIKLPVPHEDQYERYERYVKDCEYIDKNPPDITKDVTTWRKGFEEWQRNQ